MQISIREPRLSDETEFLEAMVQSEVLHDQWIKVPKNQTEFSEYFQRCQRDNQKSFFLTSERGVIVGVFNISEIVRGFFQSAYLGFYAVDPYEGKGYMSKGIKLVLEKVFNDLKLHRLEANIQPHNARSIQLVKNNGFRKEGFSPKYLNINGEWRDHERWAITLEDYTKQ